MWNWRAGWRGGGKFAQLKAISLMLHFRAIFCINLGIEAKMGPDRWKIEEGNVLGWNCNSWAETWQNHFGSNPQITITRSAFSKLHFRFSLYQQSCRISLYYMSDHWTREIDDEKSSFTMKEQHISARFDFPFKYRCRTPGASYW